jgi:hypothetical protein
MGLKRDAAARTPSSAMLVQMLFVMSALGTGAVGALVTWLGPKREKPAEKSEAPREE